MKGKERKLQESGEGMMESGEAGHVSVTFLPDLFVLHCNTICALQGDGEQSDLDVVLK